MERIWVVAPKALARAVRKELPDLRRGNLVLEPSPRDTAPAIALACEAVVRRDPDAVTAFFPTDHRVRDARAFAAAVRLSAAEARRGSLVCLGIRPDRPATGFGWLRVARARAGRAVDVERFVEKPDLARARRFVRSGRYLWNAGMFVWRADRFLEEMARTAPGIAASVRKAASGSAAAWRRAERKSVDYAVMEKARGVKVVPLDAGWDDVGSWDAVAALHADAPLPDGVVAVDSPGTFALTTGRAVSVIGVPGVIVVETADAVLVVESGRSEEVRSVLRTYEARGRSDLL